jgi:4-hydroxybenzoate polyprenyltransferase
MQPTAPATALQNDPELPSLYRSVRNFLRVEYLPFTSLMPLLGGASTSVKLSLGTISWLLGLAFSFHLYSMLLNDVVDLPVDRRQPGRQNYPLVRGTIKPWQVMVIVVLQVPIMFGLIWLQHGTAWAYGSMAAALVIVTVYDVWGKTSPVPPLMDVFASVPFGLLVVCGAALVGAPTATAFLVGVWISLWETLTNALGGLRDMEFDGRCGMSTTPLMLGGRTDAEGRSTLPRRLAIYVYALEATFLPVILAAVAQDDLGYGRSTKWVLAGACVAFRALAYVLTWIFLGVAALGCREMARMIVLHLSVSLMPVIILFVPSVNGWLIGLIGAAFVVPTLKFAPRAVAHFRRLRAEAS